MERKIGIIYSSVDGQTIKICEKLNRNFNQVKIESKLYSITEFNETISEFHTLIIGASIRYGKHSDQIFKFISKNKEQLSKINTAFFSVNLVARKENKNSPNTNPYLLKFIKKVEWTPNFLDVFAGKLDYKSYKLMDRLMIKLIMKLTDGPTKTNHPIEFTDWQKVESFTLKLIENYRKTTF